MHQTGTRMTNEVVRDGVVHHSAAVDVYAFEQQGKHHYVRTFAAEEPKSILIWINLCIIRSNQRAATALQNISR